MEYLFIAKKTQNDVTIERLIKEIFEDISTRVTNESLYIGEIEIQYKIERKRANSRCYLELKSTARVDKGVKALSIIDKEIMTSAKQKYFTCIRVFDGVSESYCERLYPRYSKFERKMRQLVLLVLTKAFGASWDKETISKKEMDSLKEIARKKVVDEKTKERNIPISEILEQMDLYTLEKYLFERREVEYGEFFKTYLSKDKLLEMEKNDICNVIDKMRPKSLWERHFEQFGKQNEWEERIKSVHEVRNYVAHNKTVSNEEYQVTVKRLSIINKKLEETIKKIEDQEFNDLTIVDIAESFAALAKGLSGIIKKYDIDAMVNGLSNIIKNIISPISNDLLATSLNSNAFTTQQETLKRNLEDMGVQFRQSFTVPETLELPDISSETSETLHTASLMDTTFSDDEK